MNVRIISNLLDSMDRYLGQLLKKRQSSHFHGLEPFSSWMFLPLFDICKQVLDLTYKGVKNPYKPYKFLDVGCGVGTKLALARSAGWITSGIEINKKFATTGQKLYGQNNIMLGDARCFEHYGDYDLIYFYRPIRNDKMQLELEEKIYQEMQPGAVVLGCCPSNRHPVEQFPDLITIAQAPDRVGNIIFFKSRPGDNRKQLEKMFQKKLKWSVLNEVLAL